MSSSFEFPELVAPRPVGEVVAEAEDERRAALEAAREEGFAAGLDAGRAEVGPAAQALAAAAAELGAERARSAGAAEEAAAELALQVAEKVLGAALEVRPELVLEVTRGALRRLSEPVAATLLVNPEDAERVREALAALSAEHGAELTVREERRVDRGGCLIRTDVGEVDARIGAQLERAAEIVREELGA
ncbi:MAG TPA: FliH/SctL family protein [Solirubrobacterales bacterium]|nr:FliH/SctL family protein [Solirubrobacterales bacterium]